MSCKVGCTCHVQRERKKEHVYSSTLNLFSEGLLTLAHRRKTEHVASILIDWIIDCCSFSIRYVSNKVGNLNLTTLTYRLDLHAVVSRISPFELRWHVRTFKLGLHVM